MAKKRASKSDLRKEIVSRAIVNPAFRRKLFQNPEAIFGEELNPQDRAALGRLQKMIPSLEGLVKSLAGDILCGGGGCGGLA